MNFLWKRKIMNQSFCGKEKFVHHKQLIIRIVDPFVIFMNKCHNEREKKETVWLTIVQSIKKHQPLALSKSQPQKFIPYEIDWMWCDPNLATFYWWTQQSNIVTKYFCPILRYAYIDVIQSILFAVLNHISIGVWPTIDIIPVCFFFCKYLLLLLSMSETGDKIQKNACVHNTQNTYIDTLELVIHTCRRWRTIALVNDTPRKELSQMLFSTQTESRISFYGMYWDLIVLRLRFLFFFIRFHTCVPKLPK